MAVERCKTCKIPHLPARLLGQVLNELQQQTGQDIAKVLRGVAAHLRGSFPDECAACANRRQAKELAADGLFFTAMLGKGAAEDAEFLYQTPEFRAAANQHLTRGGEPHVD